MKNLIKIIAIISIIGLSVFIYGCNKNQEVAESNIRTLTFQGESENWIGSYSEESYKTNDDGYKHRSIERLLIKYKGTDIDKVGVFYYECGNGRTQFLGNVTLNNNGTLKIVDGLNGGFSLALENDIFTVTVKWKEKEESFVMHLVDDNTNDI